ncbi:PucR family transcriptional regulator [Pseudonocardia acaciae]|uniref:PucR family transcriptional regulator n=1 Tax=Pseudonocardia acaciae TaxID=551276 RepID=UPI0004921069|nr:helix-turn-helix domain-containing protein [Pseudonocardia acaciae]
MHGDDIQPIVDALATRLGRSVAVDDPSIRLIAASRHFGDEDAIRIRSVLDREVPPNIQRWVLGQVAGWTRPGVLPANEGLGLRARVCAPVRCNGMHLGYLWLIDRDGETAGADLAAAGEAADAVGLALYRRMLVRERERSREEATLRLLLSPEAEDRRAAIDDVRDSRLVADASHVVLLIAEIEDDGGEEAAVALEAAVDELRRAVPPRSTLALVQRRRAVVALVTGSGERRGLVLAERLRSRFAELTFRRHRCVVGLSGGHEGLDSLVTCHREASTAVRAARFLPMFGQVASWAALGPFALLLRVDFDELARELPFPGLRELLADDRHASLVATAEEFLDRAGDVNATARALHVHRTTLYHRLKRIEAVTGLSLQDGLDRLTLHLALKLSALSG